MDALTPVSVVIEAKQTEPLLVPMQIEVCSGVAGVAANTQTRDVT